MRDSPVIMDSSTAALPVWIVPSAGIRPPERTSTTSPTASSARLTVSVSVPRTRSAVSGSKAARASSALEAAPSARISSQWPRSMITISSASSHQKSRSKPPMRSVVAQEATNATVIASEINSIIPGWRCLISCHAPVRKGAPP